ncbi:hypothetical protein LCGC14_2649820, partial [marine sediment metagenome]
SVEDTTATLTWVTNSDTCLRRYDIYLENESNGTGTVIRLGNVLTYDLTGLLEKTNYSAYIVGHDSWGYFKNSDPVYFTTKGTDISKPSISLVPNTLSDTTFDLEWEWINPSFTVLRWELTEVTPSAGLDYSGALQYKAFTGKTENTLHQYTLIAYDALVAGTPSTISATFSVTTENTATEALTAPSIVPSTSAFTSTSVAYSVLIGAESERESTDGWMVRYNVFGERALSSPEYRYDTFGTNINIRGLSGLIPNTVYQFDAKALAVSGSNYTDSVYGSIVTMVTDVVPITNGVRVAISNIDYSTAEGTLEFYNGDASSTINIRVKITAYENLWSGSILTTEVTGHSCVFATLSPDTVFSDRTYEITLTSEGKYSDTFQLFGDVGTAVDMKVWITATDGVNGVDIGYATKRLPV